MEHFNLNLRNILTLSSSRTVWWIIQLLHRGRNSGRTQIKYSFGGLHSIQNSAAKLTQTTGTLTTYRLVTNTHIVRHLDGKFRIVSLLHNVQLMVKKFKILKLSLFLISLWYRYLTYNFSHMALLIHLSLMDTTLTFWFLGLSWRLPRGSELTAKVIEWKKNLYFQMNTRCESWQINFLMCVTTKIGK